MARFVAAAVADSTGTHGENVVVTDASNPVMPRSYSVSLIGI